MIDDGSTDAIPRLLTKPYHSIVGCVSCGWPATGGGPAFDAGFRAARGEVIATIDADLQNEPEEIPRLMALF